MALKASCALQGIPISVFDWCFKYLVFVAKSLDSMDETTKQFLINQIFTLGEYDWRIGEASFLHSNPAPTWQGTQQGAKCSRFSQRGCKVSKFSFVAQLLCNYEVACPLNLIEGAEQYVTLTTRRDPICIRSWNSANSIGNINTAESLKKNRKQCVSRRKGSPILGPVSWLDYKFIPKWTNKILRWKGTISFFFLKMGGGIGLFTTLVPKVL